MTALESQLESEHEERTLLVREKHELERQLLSMAQHAAHAADDDTIHKLKRDLKRTKALLKDAHSQLDRARQETPSKVLLRQLKNQVSFLYLLFISCRYLIFYSNFRHNSLKILNSLVRRLSKDVNIASKSCLRLSNSWKKPLGCVVRLKTSI